MSFVVIKQSKNKIEGTYDYGPLIQWFHAERKLYEIVEITEMSRRSFEEIKKEYPEAFIQEIKNFEEPKVVEKKSPPRKETSPEPNSTEAVISDDNFKYKCESCGLKTPSLGGIRRHITKMHGKGACKVIDLATNLPLEEEVENDDAPSVEQIIHERQTEEAIAKSEEAKAIPVVSSAPTEEVAFVRPTPKKRDW